MRTAITLDDKLLERVKTERLVQHGRFSSGSTTLLQNQ